MIHRRNPRFLRSLAGARGLLNTFLVVMTLLAMTTTLRASGGKPAFLNEAVSGVPAAGSTYQFWFTRLCSVDPLGECQCNVDPSNNDCIAQDTNGDGQLDFELDADGDGILNIVDPDFTLGWGSPFVAESVPYNVQQTLDVFINTFGWIQPFWNEVVERDVHIRDFKAHGRAQPNGSRMELDTEVMLQGAPKPRGTLLHELYHMTQFAYNAYGGVGDWFIEGQARFMEDKVFADLDQYADSHFVGAAGKYLGNPNYWRLLDLDDDGTEETNVPNGLLGADYDTALFWNYLTEQAGTSLAGMTGEGVDFIEDVLSQSYPIGPKGQLATNIVLENRLNRSFDEMWWDFIIANYTKDWDLSRLAHSTIDGRDPESVLDYRDEAGTPYGTVQTRKITANSLIAGQGGSVNPLEFNVTSVQGTLQVSASGEMPAYGVFYYEMDLPDASACPVAVWRVTGDVGSELLHSWLLIQEDSNGDHADDVIDLRLHKGDGFEISLLSNDDYTTMVAIVATETEPEGFDWQAYCSTPSLQIFRPTRDDPDPVGAPENPGNFNVWLQVVDSISGDPIAGLDALRDFAVTVGGDPAQINSGDYVQNQYLLAVHAPDKPGAKAGDLFDVTVELVSNGATDTQAVSVVYEYRPVDSVLVIDRSGSMALEDKMEAAQDAARLFVDGTSQGDILGVASFSNNAREDYPMTALPDQDDSAGVRAGAHAAINVIVPSNQTSIGDGLMEARDMLIASGKSEHSWDIVLLSDGAENEPARWWQVAPAIIATGADVHAIALGSDADRDKMREIAMSTCGKHRVLDCYWPVGDDGEPVAAADVSVAGNLANHLADTYLRIAEVATDRQRLWQERGSGVTNETIQFELSHDARNGLFSFNWKNPSNPLTVNVTGPAGATFVRRKDNNTHEVLYAEDLPAGSYSISLQGNNAVWTGSLSANISDGVELLPAFDNTEAERVLGVPARLRVSLVDADGPVSNASVIATVTRPDSATKEQVHLRDDGVGADNRAGDGFYSYDYDRINAVEAHNYTFDIVASGPGFERYRRVTYRPADTSTPDANGDLLYDPWQKRYGVVGADRDPDLDTLTNREEMLLGTDPTHPDTDRGGETDGSEIDHFRNPLDETDDAIGPLFDFSVENRVGSVLLRFNRRDEYQNVRVFRRTADTPWSPIGQFAAPTGVVTDTNLINDEEYLYVIQPLGLDNVQGAPSMRRLAEPAADPIPPDALLLINGDAPVTGNLNVTLKFIGNPSDISHVTLSNTPYPSPAQWQPYANEIPWTIEPDPVSGMAWVYARLRDAAGNTNTYSIHDGILYDPTQQPNPGEIVGADDGTLEPGVWWIGDYPPAGVGGPDLRTAQADGVGLQRVLSADAASAASEERLQLTSPWREGSIIGAGSASKTQWQRTDQGGSEDRFVDTVDLAYFTGQARAVGLGFLNDDGTGINVLTPANTEGAYGDGDVDWIGLAASRVLRGERGKDWANSMNGLRLLMGFQSLRADVAHGPEFARYLRLGYTFSQAWFKAVDRLQPEGVTARILAERLVYFNDSQEEHDAQTEVDDIYCSMVHANGSRPQAVFTSEKLESLPKIPVPALTKGEADSWFRLLAAQFGVSAADPISAPGIGTIVSADGQLEVDESTGAYQYVPTDELWIWRTHVLGDRSVQPGEARKIADTFLQDSGLLPADMLFKEIVADTTTCSSKTKAVGAAAQTVTAVSEYQIIYARTVEVGLAGGQTMNIPVYGPGSSVRVYVKANAPAATTDADRIVGVMGVKPTAPLAAARAADTQAVTPLSFALLKKLALEPELASLVALNPTSLDDVAETRIEKHGFAYWQGPMNWRQDELIPIYQLQTASRLNDGSTVAHTGYFPAAAQYMPPLTRIVSVRIKGKGGPLSEVRPGDTLILEGFDAAKALKDAGYDASLDFTLGSGGEDNYAYSWYLGQAYTSNEIGVGRVLEYTVPDLWAADTREVVVVLEVVDKASPSENNRSTVSYPLKLVEGSGDIYLPLIQGK